MSATPGTTPIPPDQIKAQADAWAADATLAAGERDSPDHAAARRRVAIQFLEVHFPDRRQAEIQACLAGIDLAKPVQVVNAAGVPAEQTTTIGATAPRSAPTHLLGERLRPAKPEAPVYALRFWPTGHARSTQP